jgi:NTE family protein
MPNRSREASPVQPVFSGPSARGDARGNDSEPRRGSNPASTRAPAATPERKGHAGPVELENKRIVLLLQGGGALGAYQVGAFRALAAKLGERKVDWVGGISIGAVNAAVIAGPKAYPGEKPDPVKRLIDLWANDLAEPRLPPWDFTAPWSWLARAMPTLSRWTEPLTTRCESMARVLPPFPYARLAAKWWNWSRLAFGWRGKANFFSSRVLTPWNPWFLQWWRPLSPGQLAFYDTEPLRKTLEKHVDFDAINGANGKEKVTRLSLGAARVRTGEVVFFENEPRVGEPRCRKIRSDHVLASGALPPAFPPILVEDEGFEDAKSDNAWYWDGGVSSNTPIEWLIDELLPKPGEKPTIVFLIDLWDRKGPMPTSMDEACWRQKSIEYGSLRDAAKRAVMAARLKRRAQPQSEAHPPRLEVFQLLLEWSAAEPQFAFADADFSRASLDELLVRGEEDMAAALAAPYQVSVMDGRHLDQETLEAEQDDCEVVLYRYGRCNKHTLTDQIIRRQRAPVAVD